MAELPTASVRARIDLGFLLFCAAMRLDHGRHLAYCTNVHPGKDWAQTFDSLTRYTLEVKRRLGRVGPYAIGLRLGDEASRELSDKSRLLEFQRWLDKNEAYVFTINGFPFGSFHGTRVKETVYLPDWTDPRRLEYTNRLFELLAQIAPRDVGGSVSTLPGSFKECVRSKEQETLIRKNLWTCVEHISRVSERSGRDLHLGLEPEPLCWLENSVETAQFFDQMREERPGDSRLNRHLGLNYDACHFAIEFEEPGEALARLQAHGIRLSKVHISNALKLEPNPANLKQLAAFAEGVYLHQVIVRGEGGHLARFKDLEEALSGSLARDVAAHDEWRVHFHIPLHCQPPSGFQSTSDHVCALLEILDDSPELCSHFEMETYTWAVLPEPLRTKDVCDQLVAEYQWTLSRLGKCSGKNGNKPVG